MLLAGGHGLVIGAVAIATRIGFSTLMIGLTIVAFGTSAPELAFNVIAAVSGSPDLSFGNVVGSNIANIGLVLGVVAVASGDAWSAAAPEMLLRAPFVADNAAGGGGNPNSWNSAHASRGCGQEDLQGTGGDGLFYCFAI